MPRGIRSRFEVLQVRSDPSLTAGAPHARLLPRSGLSGNLIR